MGTTRDSQHRPRPINGHQVLTDTRTERRSASECIKETRPRYVPRELSAFDEQVRRLLATTSVAKAARELGVTVYRVKGARDRILDFVAYQKAMAG